MLNFVRGVAQLACAIIVVKVAIQAVSEVDRKIAQRRQQQ